MADVLIWWLVVQILGLAALPVAWHLFASLSDRGYAFAKPLGIFVTTYILWILAIFGVARNSRETVVFIVLALAVSSWWWVIRRGAGVGKAPTPQPAAAPRRVSAASGKMKRQKRQPARGVALPEILTWLRANVRIIAIEEALFLAGLLIWAFFKSYNPEIVATEKPMELAFLNGILRSEQFPPLDPWLSGYSISYYYMGYLMMAVLTRLSALASGITFNLMQVLGFALTLTGAFSIVYNLVARRTQGIAPVAFGLLGSFFVTVMGNLQGLLESLYIRGMGSPAFWQAVGIADMTQPYVSGTWYPTTNWWWWKASRVIGTKGAIGDYTINEFPFFSFMLGDNHPHVLALPYVLMALALGLSIMLAPHVDLLQLVREKRWKSLVGIWLVPALMLVGLFFLNAWDILAYTVIAVVAFGVRLYRQRRQLDSDALKVIALFAVPILSIGVVLYLPFFLSFQSQASGFGVVRVRSQLHHFLIIFGTFLLILAGFLALKLAEWRSWLAERQAAARRLVMPFLVIGLVIAAAMVALQVWTTVTTLLLTSIAGVLVSLLLLAFILLCAFLFVAHVHADLSDVFVLLVAGVACIALLGPEWLYLNDNFGGDLSRMNTVFKFHYQAWILLAVASAYGVYIIVTHRLSAAPQRISVSRIVYGIAVIIMVASCTLYPIMAFYTKANQFQGTPTLDGTAYMRTSAPDDYNAIQWLNRNIKGTPTILESVGGSYTEYARVATHTGLPTVIGWPGHEIQWRGTAKGWEAREGDVNRIYATVDVNEAKTLLKKYSVQYVYVGRLERDARGQDGKPKNDSTALGKFATFMDTIYQQGNVTIYRMRE